MAQDTAAGLDLRALSEDAFAAHYGADRFTCEVLANRARYVAEHICTALLHRAFSPIITFSQDFVGAVIGSPQQDYPLTAVNKGNVIFLGSLSTGVRNTVREFGLERLEPGDVLICNDPFRVGNHVNDMCFIRPVFYSGAVVSFVVIRAHQLDMGGTVPGGFSLLKANVYENGLVMSPQRIFHHDEPVREVMRTIIDNTRFGDTLLPDFYTIRACCALGERLLTESIERYGITAWSGAMRYNIDAAAGAMRSAIASLPDGRWQGADWVDSDGLSANAALRLQVTVTKCGAHMEVDLSGCSRQARTALNATALDAQTAVALAVKLVLDPFTPFTSGLYRDIDVVIPPGSITSAEPDAAVMFYFEVQSALVNAMLRALAIPLGRHAIGGAYGSTNLHTGEGRNADGSAWFSAAELEAQYGAWGATDAGDGNNHCGLAMLNMIMPSVEEIEPRVPALIMDREYLADSAGPGQHRGGAGLVKQSVFLSAGNHYLVPLHYRTASGSGVCGGGEGRPGGVWWFANDDTRDLPADQLSVPDACDFRGATAVAGRVDATTGCPDPSGEFAFFGREAVWQMGRGAVLRWRTNGGGGWGDPYQRDPQAVLRDVRDEYVSIEGARRDYGVCIVGEPAMDPEGLAIDQEQTARLRGAARSPQQTACAPGLPQIEDGVSIVRETVAGVCPACHSETLAAYPVLSEGGWFKVVKCQACLASLSREPDAAGPIVLRSSRV